MKLHRSGTVPQWKEVKKRDRNVWQKIAAETFGILTISNIVTLLGFGLVVWGLTDLLRHEYWVGLLLIAIGRFADVVDGWAAEITQTKSPLGELLDASLDKVGTFMMLVTMLLLSIAPWWLLLAMLLPHILISLVTMAAVQFKRRLHPSRTGKTSMALLWIALLCLVLIRAAGFTSPVIIGIVYGLCITSAILGYVTCYGYMHDALKRRFK